MPTKHCLNGNEKQRERPKLRTLSLKEPEDRGAKSQGARMPILMTRGPGNRNPFQATDLSDSTF